MALRKNLMALTIIVPVIVVGGSLYFVTRASQLRAGQPATIPQPQGWVAFDADYVDYGPGRPGTTGRYHRAGDGSLRQEVWTDDRTHWLLNIVNIPSRTAYLYSSDTQKWAIQPVEVPAGGYSAPQQQWRISTTGLRRLQDPYEGMEVYEYSGRGDIRIMAPMLNFFTVRSFAPVTGRTVEFRNIQLRAQSADLFMPPPDVTTFEKLDEPLVMRFVESTR